MIFTVKTQARIDDFDRFGVMSPEALERRATSFRIAYRRALGGSGEVSVRFAGDDAGGMVGIYDAQDTLCALLRYA